MFSSSVKPLSLLLAAVLLVSLFLLPGCTFSSRSEFPLPKDSTPVFKVSYNKLHVDWDQAIADAYEIMGRLYDGDKPKELTVQVEKDQIIVNYPGFSTESPFHFFEAYSTLNFSNDLLRSLNEAASQQDDRIPAAEAPLLGGIYDVFRLRVTMGDPSAPFIDDTLAAGEHRTRGLHLLNVPVSIDVFFPKAQAVIEAPLQALVEKEPILEHVFLSLSMDYDNDIDGIYIKQLQLYVSVFCAEGTDQKEILECSEKILRTINRLCQRQDPTIADPDENSYGGIYDYASLIFVAGGADHTIYYDGTHNPEDPPFRVEDFLVKDSDSSQQSTSEVSSS